MKKKCNKCGIEKPLEEFYRKKSNKDGYHYTCKKCSSEYQKKLHEKNPEKHNSSARRTYQKNKEKYTKRNRERWKEYNKKRKKTPRNPEKTKENHKKYYQKNRDKVLKQCKKYRQENRKKRYKQELEKKSSNFLYQLTCAMRSRTSIILKRKKIKKNNKTINIIGCSMKFLKEYLERQFKEAMTWENYGNKGWHIDHIIPLASATTEEEVYKLCHYTNLQPLWAHENLSKGSKIL